MKNTTQQTKFMKVSFWGFGDLNTAPLIVKTNHNLLFNNAGELSSSKTKYLIKRHERDVLNHMSTEEKNNCIKVVDTKTNITKFVKLTQKDKDFLNSLVNCIERGAKKMNNFQPII